MIRTILVVGVLAFSMRYCYQHMDTTLEDCKYIVEIGGCNQYRCGVKFDDGSTGALPYPVLGERHCKRVTRWK